MQKNRGLFYSACRCATFFPFNCNMQVRTYSTVRPPPRLHHLRAHTANTRFVNALCWQVRAVNPTVILCGRFSSNASLFYLIGKVELHRSGLNPDRHRKVQTRFISASLTCSQMEGAQCNSAQTGKRQWNTTHTHKKKKGEREKKKSIQADHHSSLSLG